MLSLLNRFAALSLASGMLMTLIPEGSIRKTAGMAVGLLMLLCWSEGISTLLDQAGTINASPLPETVLSATGYDSTQAWNEATGAILQQMEAGS